jgi:hypothetical protein
MATTARRKTTTERGLGWRHQQMADALKRKHQDGTPCDWDGRPMYLDRTKNWDYDPESTNPASGALQADHSKMSRGEALRRGLPIPLPDRLLHGECNRQRGDGRNDHLAWINTGRPPVIDGVSGGGELLLMAWP